MKDTNLSNISGATTNQGFVDEGASYLTPEFIPVQREERIYIGIRLVDGGERVDLSPKQLRQLNDKVKEITTIDREYCLLFASNTNIYVNRPLARKRIPPAWILTILPFIPIDDSINPYLDGTHLYVNLELYPDYIERYNKMYFQLEETLRDYYKRGAIVCDQIFANQWQLTPFLVDEESTVGVYLPLWQDIRFAPDRVEFLSSRMGGEEGIWLNLPPWTYQAASNYLSEHGVEGFGTEDGFVFFSSDIDTIRRHTSYLSSLTIEYG